jgi:DNA ligase 1
MKIHKPMLACSQNVTEQNMHELKFPCWVTPKFDGIRCLIHEGQAYSRSLKLIPNCQIQEFARKNRKQMQGYDGEIVAGTFHETQSRCMTEFSGPFDFKYHVFDRWDLPKENYLHRMQNLHYKGGNDSLRLVIPFLAQSKADVVALFDSCIRQGYEGLIIRQDCKYKHGRSTWKEQWMLKMKQFDDEEGIIVDYFEEMENLNEKTTNELGYSKRSSHAANKQGKGTLGALKVQRADGGVFNLGVGSQTDAQRQLLWDARASLVGQAVTYKFQVQGCKDKPRAPIYKSIRRIL